MARSHPHNMMGLPEREIRRLVVTPIVAQKYGCQSCNRAAAVEVNRSIVIKNYHGGEIHENVFPRMDFVESAISRMSAPELREVQRLTAERLSDLGVSVGAAELRQ